MPKNIKVSEELDQLIQSLKKTRITRRNKKTMKGGTGTIIASGTYSVVTSDKITCKGEEYKWKSKFYNKNNQNNQNVVYKILTDENEYNRELKNAEYLENKFENKTNLIYPLAGCTTPVTLEITELLNQHYVDKDIAEKRVNKNAETVYILTIENAGIPLAKFNEDISDETIISLIYELIDSITNLHDNNIAHGDINPFNITIKKDENGNFKLFIIDFGNIKLNADKLDKDADLENLSECIKILSNKLNNKDLNSKINNSVTSQITDKLIQNLHNVLPSRSLKTFEQMVAEYTTRQNNNEQSGTPPGSPIRGSPYGTPMTTRKRSPGSETDKNPSPPKAPGKGRGRNSI